jgi:hypothetical protein
MDMMRPVSVALPPNKPDGLAFSFTGTGNNRRIVLTWNDNSINETAFVVQRTTNGTTWTNVGTSSSPLDQPNTHGVRTLTDATSNAATAYLYRVIAQNTIGYGAEFPAMTVQSVSASMGVNAPAAPTNLAATLQAGPQIRVTWSDNANNETSYVLVRTVNGTILTTTLGVNTTSYVDTGVLPGNTYTYQVAAVNVAGTTASPTTAGVIVPSVPAAPTNFAAANGPNGGGNSRSIILTWTDNSNNETGFTIQRATNAGFTGNSVNTVTVGPNLTTLTQTGLTRNTAYYYRIRANNGTIIFSGWVNATPFPRITNP